MVPVIKDNEASHRILSDFAGHPELAMISAGFRIGREMRSIGGEMINSIHRGVGDRDGAIIQNGDSTWPWM